MTLYAYYTGSYRSPEEAIKNGADYFIAHIDDPNSFSFVSHDGDETKFLTGETNRIKYNTNQGELSTVLSSSQNTLTLLGQEGEIEYFININNKPYLIEIESAGVITL